MNITAQMVKELRDKTGAAYAEVDYNRNYSPLSVGETDKYFKDLNSWDSRNLYVPGQHPGQCFHLRLCLGYLR